VCCFEVTERNVLSFLVWPSRFESITEVPIQRVLVRLLHRAPLLLPVQAVATSEAFFSRPEPFWWWSLLVHFSGRSGPPPFWGTVGFVLMKDVLGFSLLSIRLSLTAVPAVPKRSDVNPPALKEVLPP